MGRQNIGAGLAVVRQANPREEIRRQRVFAWVVTALLLGSSPHLSRWLVVDGQSRAKSKLQIHMAFALRAHNLVIPSRNRLSDQE